MYSAPSPTVKSIKKEKVSVVFENEPVIVSSYTLSCVDLMAVPCNNAGITVCSTSTFSQIEQCEPSVKPFWVSLGSIRSSITGVCSSVLSIISLSSTSPQSVHSLCFAPSTLHVAAVSSIQSEDTCMCNHFAYTDMFCVRGTSSNELAVNGFCHVPLSQYQPSKLYASFVGSDGIFNVSFPFVLILSYISPSTTKSTLNSTSPQDARPTVVTKISRRENSETKIFFIIISQIKG